jgi:hypothetical protein
LFTGSEPAALTIRIKTMFDNLTLADRFAALKAEADRIEKLLTAAKAEIKATGLALVEAGKIFLFFSSRNGCGLRR